MSVKEVELNIPGEFKDEPFFYNIIKDFVVIPFILEASFSTDMGWAIVRLEGDDNEIERLLNYLKKKGVGINFL